MNKTYCSLFCILRLIKFYLAIFCFNTNFIVKCAVKTFKKYLKGPFINNNLQFYKINFYIKILLIIKVYFSYLDF